MPNRRALVVGIDDYPGSRLAGCVNDANAIGALLATNHDGSPNFDVQYLRSSEVSVTRSLLRQRIEQLFNHDDADFALLYFAGHGTENNLGGYLVTQDSSRYDEGVNLTEVLSLANNATARERVILLYSCMSGHLGAVPSISPSSNMASVAEGVSILTAARASQAAVESGGRGVFTELVCSALEGGAADVIGEVTAPAIYSYVEEALGPWDQRPLFKGHLTRVAALRIAQPAVPLATLRKLAVWFPKVDSEFQLDPSYEYTTADAVDDHVAVFQSLQKCRDAKLVEAVDETFLYFAAMNSKSCRLTALGQHYWRLVV